MMHFFRQQDRNHMVLKMLMPACLLFLFFHLLLSLFPFEWAQELTKNDQGSNNGHTHRNTQDNNAGDTAIQRYEYKWR